MLSTLFDAKSRAREAGAAVIDDPIVNRPYEEPLQHWDTIDWEKHEQKATPELKEGRRPAGYFYNPKGAKGTGSILEEEFVPLHGVNEIRRRVSEWRARGYAGVTPVTRRLLEHWSDDTRERKLFYCQREALETVIWLTEAHPADRQGVIVENADGERVPLEKAHEPFLRHCSKMATGTGKTVVMAMVIAWQALNKAQYPQDTRFTDAILIVGPGLTVKERLQVLLPENQDNYYDKFELVPPALRANLSQARICILHRQAMAIQDDRKNRGIVKLGEESDRAFANRLLRPLGSRNRILVLNDEGHHCYRPREKPIEPAEDKPTKDEKEENKRAAQWISGLEKIHSAREIMACLDFSATPFYIHGSGYPVGRPFPWVVSDFGLLDAIESGLVKIPVMPIDDNHGDGRAPPAYFHLWRWINERLAPEHRQIATRRANPEAVVREAEPAIVTMIGNWKRAADEWEKEGSAIPPCMIVVSQDTDISKLIFERFTREDFEFDDFVNRNGHEVSFLFDSKSLKDLEKLEEGENVKEREARLREILNTVGKEGKAGEQVRFVSSVSMLTEGWDAQNVTQIVGLRAFTSQLLCEQVVGRALRRSSYDVNEETGMLEAEQAEIYGVPFQVIPVKAVKGGGAPPKPTQLVMAIKDREEEHLISFPRVEGYLTEIREQVTCAWEDVPALRVGKSGEPTLVKVGAILGHKIGRPDAAPGRVGEHNRVPYYKVARLQPTMYRMAADLVDQFLARDGAAVDRRRVLFPQFLEIVRRYVGEFIEFEAVPQEEIGLAKWKDRILNALIEHIHPLDGDGREIILPRIERYRKEGTTREVLFRTGRPCYATTKSHISHVVLDSVLWEKVAAQHLEASEFVQSYARNDHLDFTLPCLDFTTGTHRNHRPDFIARLTTGLHVALEVKGHEREKDEAKKAAGLKWAKAVNNYYGERRWVYHVCYDPDRLSVELAEIANGERWEP